MIKGQRRTGNAERRTANEERETRNGKTNEKRSETLSHLTPERGFGTLLDMRTIVTLLILWGSTGGLFGQRVWQVPQRSRAILVDGYLNDWQGIQGLAIAPQQPGIRSNGSFHPNDVAVVLRALWDKEKLYIAVQWQDDKWDVKQVPPRQAIWISPDHRRRDRMYFFDNLRLNLRQGDHDYLLWTSPRLEEEGPFMWQRLVKLPAGLENASYPPMVSARYQKGVSTLEMLFFWKQLQMKGKKGETVSLGAVVTDSDMPGAFLETKLPHLKSLGWSGEMRLSQTRR